MSESDSSSVDHYSAKTHFNQALQTDYDSAWKLIEYNMKTNWQNLVGIASLIGVMHLIYPLFKYNQQVEFIGSCIVLLILISFLWLLFFKIYTILAHVYSLRRLEIEALSGLRTCWRGYLSNNELKKDIDRWIKKDKTCDNGFKDGDLEKVRKSIENEQADNSILLKVINRKYLEDEKALTQWYVKKITGRIIAYVSISLTISWGIFLFIAYFYL